MAFETIRYVPSLPSKSTPNNCPVTTFATFSLQCFIIFNNTSPSNCTVRTIGAETAPFSSAPTLIDGTDAMIRLQRRRKLDSKKPAAKSTAHSVRNDRPRSPLIHLVDEIELSQY